MPRRQHMQAQSAPWLQLSTLTACGLANARLSISKDRVCGSTVLVERAKPSSLMTATSCPRRQERLIPRPRPASAQTSWQSALDWKGNEE
eukprot:3764053-Amphidinium_carterae.1